MSMSFLLNFFWIPSGILHWQLAVYRTLKYHWVNRMPCCETGFPAGFDANAADAVRQIVLQMHLCAYLSHVSVQGQESFRRI